MIYIEEEKDKLYKYKVDANENRLNEILKELEKGIFRFSSTINSDILSKEEIDFGYLPVSQVNENYANILTYYIHKYPKLYEIVTGLLGYETDLRKYLGSSDESVSKDILKINGLLDLLNYEKEIPLITLIDNEIEKRISSINKMGEYDFSDKCKEIYILRELYKQREVILTIPDVSYLSKEVENALTFERIDEISKKEYEEYLRFMQGDTCVIKRDKKRVYKNKVVWDSDLGNILYSISFTTRYKGKDGEFKSTILENIIYDIVFNGGNPISLLNYDYRKEPINIYKKKCNEYLEEINKLNNKKNKTIKDYESLGILLKTAKNEFPYASYNMKVKPIQNYYEEVLKTLDYMVVSSMDFNTFSKCEKFNLDVTEPVMSLVLKK